MYKQANLSFSITAQAYGDDVTAVQFSTQDKNSAKLIFTIKEGKQPLDLTDVEGLVDLVMGDKSVFDDNKATVTAPLDGKLEYTLTPEQIRHSGRAKGELQLVSKDGQAIGGFRFNFTIRPALVDEYAGPIKEFYIEDLEAVKQEVKKKADAVVLDIDKFKVDIDSRTAVIEEQLDSLDDNVGQSTVLQVDAAKKDTTGQTHSDLDSRIKAEVGKINTKQGELTAQLADIGKLKLVANIDSTTYKSGQKVDIEDIKTMQITYFANFQRKLKNGQATKIATKGDSLTYGLDTISADKRPYDPMILPDGTYHATTATRASKTYPEALSEFLNQIYPNKVTVVNHGRSSDWVKKGYERWYTKHDADLTIAMYGTNDVNGSWVPEDYRGLLHEYINWYEQLIIREILWGKAVVILTPPKLQNANMVDLDVYSNALFDLGKKYGVPVVDSELFTANYSYDIYSDGTHFNGTGYTIFGSKVASFLLGSLSNPIKVHDGTKLLTRPNVDCVIPVNANITPYTSGDNGTPDEVPGRGIKASIFTGGSLFYSFYAETDDLLVIPYGSITDRMNVTLDFGVQQAQNSIDKAISTINTLDDDSPSVLTYIGSQFNATLIDKSQIISSNKPAIKIPTKGWHTLRISAINQPVYFDGIEFISHSNLDTLKSFYNNVPRFTQKYFKIYSSYQASPPAVTTTRIPLADLPTIKELVMDDGEWKQPAYKISLTNAGASYIEYLFMLGKLSNGANTIFLGEALRKTAVTTPIERTITNITFDSATKEVVITWGGTLTIQSVFTISIA